MSHFENHSGAMKRYWYFSHYSPLLVDPRSSRIDKISLLSERNGTININIIPYPTCNFHSSDFDSYESEKIRNEKDSTRKTLCSPSTAIPHNLLISVSNEVTRYLCTYMFPSLNRSAKVWSIFTFCYAWNKCLTTSTSQLVLQDVWFENIHFFYRWWTECLT